MTLLIGLTGSIGMGKTTIAAMFPAFGVPVFDADATVHRLYAGRAVAPVAAVFADVVSDGIIDRARLAARIASEPEGFARLERIVHPLVREEESAFIAACHAGRRPLAVLDIPLLLETRERMRARDAGDIDWRCDLVAVVSAPVPIQRARVLARPGMTEARLELILSRQMPDPKKRAQAHFIIDNGGAMDDSRGQVVSLIRALAGRQGKIKARSAL
jgi:dephospho-CoA kinase